MSERWVPMGMDSIDPCEGEYEGHKIKFRPGKYGAVRATLYNEDGYLVDDFVGADFMDAYTTAVNEWPGATWVNKEED